MIEPEYLKFFASLGVGGVLAGMIFYFSRQDQKKHEKDLLLRNEECEAREDKLIEVITKNTQGFERLCGALNTLSTEIRKSEELKLQQMQQLLTAALSKKNG
jgi:hypothetical protein